MTKHIYIKFLLRIWTILLPEQTENPLCNLAKMLTSVTLHGSDWYELFFSLIAF